MMCVLSMYLRLIESDLRLNCLRYRYHRRHFKYPTYLEIMTQAENLNAGVNRMLTKDQFIYMLNLWVVEPEIKHELELAFAVRSSLYLQLYL